MPISLHISSFQANCLSFCGSTNSRHWLYLYSIRPSSVLTSLLYSTENLYEGSACVQHSGFLYYSLLVAILVNCFLLSLLIPVLSKSSKIKLSEVIFPIIKNGITAVKTHLIFKTLFKENYTISKLLIESEGRGRSVRVSVGVV